MTNRASVNTVGVNSSVTAQSEEVDVWLHGEAGTHDLALLPQDAVLEASAGDFLDYQWTQKILMLAGAFTSVETFYNPQVELLAEALSNIQALPAFQEVATLAATGDLTAQDNVILGAWLQARAYAPVQTTAQRMAEHVLEAAGRLTSHDAFATLLQEVAETDLSEQNVFTLLLLDEISVELLQEFTLIVGVQETLEADAGDSVQALGHYFNNVKDMAGAWVTFKVKGEVIQGWVMNVEGERPVSEYRGFDFNSFACIGGRYFAAGDEGLYTLGADSDDGAPIDAHVRSMMLDFGSTRQKRVVAAYLGYTAEGNVVLKVRSVDDGRLTEHWYRAQEVTADAPREGYKPLGRGMKSRYWQFELANVDGADFELDKLELYPLQLGRRV